MKATNMFKRIFAASLLLATTIDVAAAADTAPTPTGNADMDALVKRGEYLSRAGDCMACHSVQGKDPYSGGLAIKSDLGTIYSTNITPDKTNGIGNYTEAQFSDAVRQGIRADGSHLYPAMPYPDYAKVSDEDIKALYAYFMHGVKPSSTKPPETDLSFPFSQRWGMSLWNWAFGDDAAFAPPANASDAVKRGAYLVQGLGHCGSCHSPRNFAMAEESYDSGEDSFLSGGNLNGWDVPSLRGLPRWSQQDIVDYLQTGRNKDSAVAGEMTSVIFNSTSHLSGDDLNAIAAYLKSLQASGAPAAQVASGSGGGSQATIAKLTAAKDLTAGERLYLDNCGACHLVTGQGATRVFPHLDGATIVNAEDPNGLISVILAGATTPSTAKAPSQLPMPGFDWRLSDQEVADLATFLRQGWSNHAGAVTADQVSKVRAALDQQKKK